MGNELLHSHYKHGSEGYYRLWRVDSEYRVGFEYYPDEWNGYSVTRFTSLEKACKYYLESVWDNPGYRGMKFPDNVCKFLHIEGE